MGADDVMLPQYVRHIREVITLHPDVAVIQPSVEVVDSFNHPILPLTDRVKAVLRPTSRRGITLLSGDRLAASLLNANWTYFPSLCWRRQTIDQIGFREGLDVVQDLALLLDVCAGGGILAITNTTAFWYRRHNESDSSLRAMDGRRFDEESRFFRLMNREFRRRHWNRAARSARWHVTSRLHALFLLPRAMRSGDLRIVGSLGRHLVGK